MQVDIDPEVKAAARMRAARDNITLSQVTEEALRVYLGVTKDQDQKVPPSEGVQA